MGTAAGVRDLTGVASTRAIGSLVSGKTKISTVSQQANKGRAEAGKALEAARVAETEAASHRATAAQKQKQIAELEVSCNVCMLGQRAGKRRLRTVFPAVLKRRQKLAGTVRSLPEGRCLSFVREVN